MLFRNIKTKQIEIINRSNFLNDSDYYKQISLLYGIHFSPKIINVKEQIIGYVKNNS
jgi:hypothetical protein